jgi:hypothetical protein
MKTFFLFSLLCGALWMGSEVRAVDSSTVMDEVEAYVKRSEAHLAEQLAKESDPLFRARIELQLRMATRMDLDQYRKRLLQSGRVSCPKVEALKAERAALYAKIKDLDQAILKAAETAPEVQALDEHRAANVSEIEALRERLTLRTPAQRRALEAKKASKNSTN